jgi:hypothetical protein
MILAGVATIALCGPGRWSLDTWFGVPTWPWLAPAALVAGFVGGIVVVNTRQTQPSLSK